MSGFGALSAAAGSASAHMLNKTGISPETKANIATKMIQRPSDSLSARDLERAMRVLQEAAGVNATSLTSSPNLSPGAELIHKIANDREKLLADGMMPKHLYLGEEEWAHLRSTHVAHHTIKPQMNKAEPVYFMRFQIYIVHTDTHYVMTGE